MNESCAAFIKIYIFFEAGTKIRETSKTITFNFVGYIKRKVKVLDMEYRMENNQRLKYTFQKYSRKHIEKKHSSIGEESINHFGSYLFTCGYNFRWKRIWNRISSRFWIFFLYKIQFKIFKTKNWYEKCVEFLWSIFIVVLFVCYFWKISITHYENEIFPVFLFFRNWYYWIPIVIFWWFSLFFAISFCCLFYFFVQWE